MEFWQISRPKRRKGIAMIRIREIAMPPEHNIAQLSYEAARVLKVSNSKIRGVRLVRRSVDARKKPDIKIVYTIDVKVDGNEAKILKQCGSKRVALAPVSFYKPPRTTVELKQRPVVVGFGPAGMFAALAFGGSSMMIVVGVALETTRELEAQMSLRNYKGFLD